MGQGKSDSEDDESERRIRAARNWLDEIYLRKRSQNSFGQSVLTLCWKNGQLEIVKMTDEVSYK